MRRRFKLFWEITVFGKEDSIFYVPKIKGDKWIYLKEKPKAYSASSHQTFKGYNASKKAKNMAMHIIRKYPNSEVLLLCWHFYKGRRYLKEWRLRNLK